MVFVGILEVTKGELYDHKDTVVRVVGVFTTVADAISAMPYKDGVETFNLHRTPEKLLEWEWDAIPEEYDDFKSYTYRVAVRKINQRMNEVNS